jgi:hypothetical protein
VCAKQPQDGQQDKTHVRLPFLIVVSGTCFCRHTYLFSLLVQWQQGY